MVTPLMVKVHMDRIKKDDDLKINLYRPFKSITMF